MVEIAEPSPLEKAISIAGSEAKLAAKAGCSQPAINKAKRRGRVSAELATKIDAALAPDVTKTDLRPDLWPPAPANHQAEAV